MATGAIGAGLVAGFKQTAKPFEEGAIDAMDNIASAEHVFNKYPETMHFAQRYRGDYAQKVHSLASQEIQKQLNMRSAAQASGHSLPKIDTGSIFAQAGNIAREHYLGPNDIEAVAATVGLENKYGIHAAQNFADTMAYLMRDRVPVGAKPNPITGISSPSGYISSIKQRAIKAGVALKDATPTYTPRTPVEKGIQAWANTTFIPLLAIPHLTTVFNGLFGTDPGTFIAGLTRSVSDGIGRNSNHWNALVQTGAMTESLMREADFYNKFHASNRTFQYPGDSVAGTVYKLFHQPGFAPLRDQMLVSAGITGKMTAEQVARDFSFKPSDPSLAWQVKEFGLDPQKILSQQGRLAQDDLDKAIFSFVDKYYFVDNNLQRSRLLSASPTGRLLGMFHSYVARQSKLMYRSMFKDFKERGAASVVRNLAIGSMLFPMLGEGVKIIGEGVRGQNAQGDFKKDLENAEFKHGADKAFLTYLEAMSHVGAVGVYAHMMRGALHHSLLNSVAGPFIGSQAELLQDTVSGLNNAYKHHGHKVGHDFRPVGRDLEYDIPYVSLGGQLLGHRLSPKKGEGRRHDPLRQLYDHITGQEN